MAGSITSQGDRAMKSNIARSIFDIDGAGIKIGVISDSFNAFQDAATDVVSGELPGRGNPQSLLKPVRVLKDDRNGTDEGRAMLQIIHDVAPGAELLFHAGGETEQTFAAAVRALVKAGANVIVDDLGYSTSAIFQDGIAAQAVTEAANQGVLYFSAAGNDGNRGYQSAFRSSNSFSFRANTYIPHDFDPGDGIDLFQDIRMSAEDVINLLLSWDQPLGRVSTELEMFLLDSPQLPGAGGNILQRDAVLLPSSINDAAKEIAYRAASDQTVYLLIASRAGSIDPVPNQMQWVSFANAADTGTRYQYVNDAPNATGGSTIFGHPNAKEAIAVGAASYRKTPVFSGKPPVLEDFSAQGGTPILFDPQGNRLPVPDVRQKPELVAPDDVTTSVLGFDAFPGTSAAAPHAAAVAALMLQRAGGTKNLTRQQVLSVMQKTAIAIDPPGNFRSGAGLLEARSAVIRSFVAERVGTAGSDVIRGSQAAENLLGFEGNDTLIGAGGYDAIFGGKGRDILRGDAGNDYLLGDMGNDILAGGAGNDTLTGDVGNDTLAGGTGKNQLRGGSGRDTFAVERSGFAVIQDFKAGQDKLGLSRQLAFTQLDFIQRGRSAIVVFRNDELAKLNGIDADSLTAASFKPVSKIF